MANLEPAADQTMIAIGGLLLVGLLFVSFLILGAIFAARTETRTIGLWIMGLTFAMAVALPMIWMFAAFDSHAPAYVRGGDGRMIPVAQPASEAAPVFARFLIGLVLVAGIVVLLVNEKTRRAGFLVLGFLGVCLLGYLVVGVSTVDVTPRPPGTLAHAPSEVMRTQPPVVEDRHQIPVDAPHVNLSEGENVTPPVPANAAAQPPATSPPTPPATSPPPVAPAASDPKKPDPNQPAAPPPAATGATSVSSVSPPGATGKVQVVSGDRNSLPEWAKQGGGIGPDGNYFTVVRCGPHLNFDNCWNDVLNRVDQVVRDYSVRHALGDGYRAPHRPLPKPLREQLMTDHFLERGDSSVGETMTLHTRVAFTREATAAIRAWQADMLANHRAIFATVFGSLVFGLVAIAYGYFRIDTATLGYYTWRLRFVALFLLIGIAISGIAAGAVFFEEEWRLGGIDF